MAEYHSSSSSSSVGTEESLSAAPAAAEDYLLTNQDMKDDSHLAALFLFSLHDFPTSTDQTGSLKFAFLHQIYAVVRDRSLVDGEMQTILKSEPPIIKSFFSHSAPDDCLICSMEDYMRAIDNMARHFYSDRGALPTELYNGKKADIASAIHKIKSWAGTSQQSVFEDDLRQGIFTGLIY